MASRRAAKNMKKYLRTHPLELDAEEKREVEKRSATIAAQTTVAADEVATPASAPNCALCKGTRVAGGQNKRGQFNQCKCVRVTKTEQRRLLKAAQVKQTLESVTPPSEPVAP